MNDCLFCKIIAGEIPSKKVYEDELCFAFYDIAPLAPTHFLVVPKKHLASAAEITEEDDTLLIRRDKPLKSTRIKTLPYPGFPTDMQPQMTTLLTLAQGTSVVTDSVWASRYRYVDELRRMGAFVQVEDKTAVVQGVEALHGAVIHAWDLRAGAAMVIAALAAQGWSEITGVEYIERGYEDIIGKLRSVGAVISASDDEACAG